MTPVDTPQDAFTPRPRTLRVWDLPTRLFHWVLMLLVFALLVSGQFGGAAMDWHARFGYAVLALLLFRILWGFVGSYHSRFSHFLPGASRLLEACRDMLRGQHRWSAGHSPLGALSVVVMLLLLFFQASSGLMSDDEIGFSGPLSGKVSGALVSFATWYHKAIGKPLLLGFILLHVVAIVYYRLRHGERLTSAMVHGDKALPLIFGEQALVASLDNGQTRFRALLCLLFSVAVTLSLVRWGLGS